MAPLIFFVIDLGCSLVKANNGRTLTDLEDQHFEVLKIKPHENSVLFTDFAKSDCDAYTILGSVRSVERGMPSSSGF